MIILTVNTGSSSVRLSLRQPDDEGSYKSIGFVRYNHGDGEPKDLLQDFLHANSIKKVDVVSHRVVHGGAALVDSQVLTNDSIAEIKRLETLAPLHNRHAVIWIQTTMKVVGPAVPQVGVFDTAFYADLPEVAATYAIPRELSGRHAIRRYGFHGLAHQAMWQRWCELRPDIPDGGRVISLQLGAGMKTRSVSMDFLYECDFGENILTDAYERLVLDALQGDASLFTRSDEIELAWRIIDPILQGWESEHAPPLEFYELGTSGPSNADEFIEADGRKWNLSE